MAFVLLVKSITGHRLLTLPNIVFVTTVVNFILYLCGWSANFFVSCSDSTYLIIIVVEIVFTIYAFAPMPETYNGSITFKRITAGHYSIRITTLFLLLSLLLTAVENIYLNGSLIAIDSSSHTDAMPLVGPINRALMPIVYSIVLIELADHKGSKTEAVLLPVHMAYSVIGARGRFWFVISACCALMVLTAYKRGTLSRIKMRYKLPIAMAIIALFIMMFNFGAERMTAPYSTYIAYTGPFKDTELASWYYGYFPYSFYNLDLTIRFIDGMNISTHGAFFVLPFLSVLQLDGLSGIDYTTMTKSISVVTNTAANVTTGYYEMYADFGKLFFVTVLVYLAITAFFEKRSTFASLISSRYMWTVWGAMSFLNVFTVGVPIYVFLLSWLLDVFIVERNYEGARNLKNDIRTVSEAERVRPHVLGHPGGQR